MTRKRNAKQIPHLGSEANHGTSSRIQGVAVKGLQQAATAGPLNERKDTGQKDTSGVGEPPGGGALRGAWEDLVIGPTCKPQGSTN